MEITYLGHASFRIRGRIAKVITDPFSESSVGFPYPKSEADVVLVSHSHGDHAGIGNIEGDPVIIAGPGEYEVKGVRIFGLSTFHDTKQGEERGLNTVYRIDIDGVSIVHLGDLGHKLSDDQLDLIDRVDVLFVPVGGIYTINTEIAKEVITQLEPTIAIPMHYRTKRHDEKQFGKLSTVEDFFKEMDLEPGEAQEKLSVTKDTLPEELIVCELLPK